MAGIQMSGLASGLDTQALISQLMSIERIPRSRIERQQGAAQARQDALKDIQTKLKALRQAGTDLQSSTLWSPTRAAISDDQTRLVARAMGGAVVAGTYDVNVTRLATSESEGYQFRQRSNATTLTFTDSTNTQTTLNLASNATIDDVITAVNASSTLGITARKDTSGNIWFDSKSTGAASIFSVTSTGGGGLLGTAAAGAVAGGDAQFTVNGAAKTSATNIDTAAITGVELDLKGLTVAGTPVKVTVTETPTDKKDVAAKLKAYADAYNAVVDTIRGKVTDKPIPNASTVTDAKRGVLYGDAGLTQVLNTLRRGMMDPFAGNSALMDEMNELGLSTGSAVASIDPNKVQGRLTFDETKFNKAWDTDRAGVENLLRGDGSTTGTGFTQRMDALIKPMTDVGASFDGRINAVGSEIKTFTDSLARMDKRLEMKEDHYKQMFTALETAMAKAQSIQAQMQGQLAGLPSTGG
jgi:flagellar hook-associated protein 2